MNRHGHAVFAGVAALALAGAAWAQSADPASPRAGNGERGRQLLEILGPRPAGGFSPLQQQELMRRVRCAATRQQIQDELDVEAAGASSSLYVMSELRMLEKENCAPVPLPAGTQPIVVPPAAPAATWRPPQAASVAPVAASRVAPAPVAPASTARAVQAAAGPTYTPAPAYPASELAAGHAGVVMVELVMDAQGAVTAAAVARSSGYPALDAAALAAAKTWRIPAAAGHTIKAPLTFTVPASAPPAPAHQSL